MLVGVHHVVSIGRLLLCVVSCVLFVALLSGVKCHVLSGVLFVVFRSCLLCVGCCLLLIGRRVLLVLVFGRCLRFVVCWLLRGVYCSMFVVV